MTSLFSYMITTFGGLFWLLRVVVAVTYTLGVDFPIVPINFSVEIILLFVAVIAMVFIIKRNVFGALVYFVAYGWYFGNDLYNNVINIINGQAIVEASGNVNINSVRDIAATGVDIISSSAIVAKAPTLDLGLDCK